MRALTRLSAALAILMLASLASGQEWPVQVYKVNGDTFGCNLVEQDGDRVSLRVGGRIQNILSEELTLIVFAIHNVNFHEDSRHRNEANPNMVVLKIGDAINGLVTRINPRTGQATVRTNRGEAHPFVNDIACIYYNPVRFFQVAQVTGQNTVNYGQGAEPEAVEPAAEQLAGGEVFIKMNNGATTRGHIYDIRGRDAEVILTDGRTFLLRDAALINYIEVSDNYPGDAILGAGGATIIMRNGSSIFAVIVDYKGADEWELADGRRIPANQIARIHIR